MADSTSILATAANALETAMAQQAADYANKETHGYKRSDIIFGSMPSTPLIPGNSNIEDGSKIPGIGIGVSTFQSHIRSQVGAPENTKSNLDFMIPKADYYVRVKDENENFFYTRACSLEKDKDNKLRIMGLEVEGDFEIQNEDREVKVSEKGEIIAKDKDGKNVSRGQLKIYYIPNTEITLEDKVFYRVNTDYEPEEETPGEASTPKLMTKVLESSNVDGTTTAVKYMDLSKSYQMVNAMLAHDEKRRNSDVDLVGR